MNCLSIITEHLKTNGHDRLCNLSLKCGCDILYLAPYEYCPHPNCVPARSSVITEEDENGELRVSDVMYVPIIEEH